jgi:hypothetical protein
MIRKLAVLALTMGLGLALVAAPAGAAPAASASPTASLSVNSPAPNSPAVTQFLCNSRGTCTYVTHSGFFVSSVSGSGFMTATGCIRASLRIDGITVATTVKKCIARGTKVAAGFSVNRTFGHGDNFQVVWSGGGHPAAPFPILFFS